jgi:hypothetical protein
LGDLSNFSASCADLATQVVKALEIELLYNRISERAFLYNFVFLTRGFFDAMVAAPDAHPHHTASELTRQLRANASLTFRLERILRGDDKREKLIADLREIAISLSVLIEVGFRTDVLFRLYGIANSNEMLHRIERWLKQPADVTSVRQFLYALMLLSDQLFARHALDILTPVIRERQRLEARNNGPRRRAQPRAQAGDVPRGLQLRDIVDIGDLLRLAAAIDEESAPELLKEFDLDRLTASCIRERNLGRHVQLLQGLHSASRSACLSLVRRVYLEARDDNSFAESLEDSDSSEQVLHLVRTLQKIAPPAAAKVVQIGVESGRERFLALLAVEANLHTASKWLRTIYSVSSTLPFGFEDEIVALMQEMFAYDMRLFSSVEAALALVDVNRPSDASRYSDHILNAGPQVRGARSLMTLIELVLRLIRVDTALGTSCLSAILEDFPPATLKDLMNAEASLVVVGYAHYLFDQHVVPSMGKYDDVLYQAGREHLARLEQVPISSSLLIARMLLGETLENWSKIASRLTPSDLVGFHPWELGLIQTVYSAVYSQDWHGLFAEEKPWEQLAVQERESIAKRRRRYFGEDVSNIRCALSLRSQFDRGLLGLSAGFVNNVMRERSASDHRSAVRLLLQQEFKLSELRKFPYYMKVLFDETIFVRSRFEWSARIVSEVHSRMFEQSDALG